MTDSTPSHTGLGSTLPEDPHRGWLVWERRLRWVAYGVIVLLVGLASFGLFGVRTDISHAAANGFSLDVTYSRIARAGIAAPFSIVIGRDNSSERQVVTVAVTSDYLALFDDNGMEPIPSSSFNDPEWTFWSFQFPSGEENLRVDLDARLEPSVQLGKSAVVRVLTGSTEMVSTEFTTTVLP